MGTAAPRSPAIPIIPPISGASARRARRSARHSPLPNVCSIPCCGRGTEGLGVWIGMWRSIGSPPALGADTVPGSYEDLDQADLLVLVGSNAAWCHPVLFQRMVENKRVRGAKIVVIDPRRTATAEDADLHLAIAPGTDTVLFCGPLAQQNRV